MFEEAFKEVLGHEGKLSLDSNDRGNWTSGTIGIGKLKGTKYGISAMSYPYLDIENLSIQEAKDIYYSDYWITAKINLLPHHLQVSVFDSVVNHGLRGGIRILQKAAGVKTDGLIGPNTVKACQDLEESIFLIYRLSYYIDIVFAKPSLLKYINGWRNRITKLLTDDF